MKKKSVLLTGIVTVLIICTAGCISNEKGTTGGTVTVTPSPKVTPSPGTYVEGNGTIWYIESGAFYAMLGDNSAEYYIVNLPDDYKVNGQRIAFTATVKDKTSSTPEGRIPIEISRIAKLPGGPEILNEEWYRKFRDNPIITPTMDNPNATPVKGSPQLPPLNRSEGNS